MFQIPDVAVGIGERMRHMFPGACLYIAGGFARDALLGRPSDDLDMTTNLRPGEIKQTVADIGGSVFDVGEKFGTIGIAFPDGEKVEVTTFRSEEVYVDGSRKPVVTFGERVEDDLCRRDFTINALALEVIPVAGRVIDPHGGTKDLERGLIRSPGLPEDRMREDPLRMLRAVRFAARLGFEIEPALLFVLQDNAAWLSDISVERRREELEKMLVSDRPDWAIRTLVTLGLMDYIAPEISALRGVEQRPDYHHLDVLDHTLMVLSLVRPDPLMRRAALFHDVGKPVAAQKTNDGKLSFHGHDNDGAEITRNIMSRLRYSSDEIKATSHLVCEHMRPHFLSGKATTAAVRRMIRKSFLCGGEDEVLVNIDNFLELAQADILSMNPFTVDKRIGEFREMISQVYEIQRSQPVEQLQSPLDGREIMALVPGMKPGPKIGEVKKRLVDLVVDGILSENDKDEATKVALEMLSS